MLKLVAISKIHQAGEIQTTALDRIDLEIEAGEYVSITGPSSSLLNAVRANYLSVVSLCPL